MSHPRKEQGPKGLLCFLAGVLMVCNAARNPVSYRGANAAMSRGDALGTCRSGSGRSVDIFGRTAPRNRREQEDGACTHLQSICNDWPTRYLWLDTLGGVGERIRATERGKSITARRSTRIDRGGGSSEFWALCSSALGVYRAEPHQTRAGFSEALAEPLGS